MKNCIIKFLIISLALLMLVGCNSSEYKYTKNDNTVTISEYSGSDANVIIPSQYEEMIIDVIDYNTYAYNIYIKNVCLSSGIKIIRECAFWYCTELETIYIPASLEKIEECAFYNCTNLKHIYYEAESANIIVGANNECFINASSTYNVSVEEYEAIINANK